MDHKTKFKPTAEKTYYYVEKNMMLGTNHGWNTNGDGGKGDALWRTGWAYVAYKSKSLKKGILSCFTKEKDSKGKEYLQAHRFPGMGAENVSRDQITSALVALSLNGDKEDVKRIVKGLRWKISPKFKLSLDMWFWMKSISADWKISKFLYSLAFTISSFIVVAPMIPWNKILYKWAKLRETSQEKYNWILHSGIQLLNTDEVKRPSIAMTIHYPAYAFYLFAWQLYTLPWNPLKTLLRKICLTGVHDSNYLMRLLFLGKVSQKDINEFRPMSGIRWQGRFFEGFYSATEIIEENYHFHTRLGLNSDYNALDNDILWYLAEKHPELIIP